ncbi:MAG TPA: aspartate carbamoyltransferase regulatory subunit [Clostridiales bacterium]|jgi:aspartate carbamoyltransferase regulatory subunit|nr:aspartate carbamoyltransferase regulatory subunit [Clostridiales bacterium]
MIIGSIVNGLVIDHIPAGKAMALYHYMGLDELTSEVAIIKNATSRKMGKKDIIKVNEVIDVDYDILGYIDSNITVNIIKDGVRTEKMHPTLPETITNVIRCKNPRCITSVEQDLPHVFKLTDRDKGIYRCIYCESRAKEPQSFKIK